MRDFTLRTLKGLFREIQKANYEFITFSDYLENSDTKTLIVILRHDVDQKPERSIKTAKLEKEMGIRGTYFFRVVNGSFPEKVIRGIISFGHEIGYHYEDLHRCRGDLNAALTSFNNNLTKLRQIAPVRTICMHGNPISKYDNRDIWNVCGYKEYGIIGEPYFDIDFNKVLYLTDTGRMWDGERFAIRDKTRGQKSENRDKKTEIRGQRSEYRSDEAQIRPRIHSTKDLMNAIKNNQLPDQIMLTIHPQRWTDEWIPWIYELVSQNIKNGVKYFIAKRVVSS